MKQSTLRLFKIYELKLRLDVKFLQENIQADPWSTEDLITTVGKYLRQREKEDRDEISHGRRFAPWGRVVLSTWLTFQQQLGEPPIDMEIYAAKLILLNLEADVIGGADHDRDYSHLVKFFHKKGIDYPALKQLPHSEWTGCLVHRALFLQAVHLFGHEFVPAKPPMSEEDRKQQRIRIENLKKSNVDDIAKLRMVIVDLTNLLIDHTAVPRTDLELILSRLE